MTALAGEWVVSAPASHPSRFEFSTDAVRVTHNTGLAVDHVPSQETLRQGRLLRSEYEPILSLNIKG